MKYIKLSLVVLMVVLPYCSNKAVPENKNPIVVFNSDGCSLSLSICEPPITTEQLCRVIDEIKDTEVDVFAWCPQLGGDSYTYPTNVGEIAYGGDDYNNIEWGNYHFRMKQQAQNVRAILDAGLDPVDILSKRTHHYGKQFWITLRMNDQHEDDVKRFGVKISRFKKQNPDLLIGTDFHPGMGAYCDKYGYSYTWNYAKKEVHEHKLAIIEELCRNYELDGFELDFQRGPWYFKKGEEKDGLGLMTEFVRRVRYLTNKIAKEKETDFTLAVRIPPSIEQARDMGLDVAVWIKEELADIFIPMDGGYLDGNADIKNFVDIAKNKKSIIAGGLESYVKIYGHATTDMLSAVTLGFYEQGAKAVYLFNYDCHRINRDKNSPTGLRYGPYTDSELEFLNIVDKPDKLKHMDKHYFITYDGKRRTKEEGGTKQLPCIIKKGETANFDFFIGDDVEKSKNNGLLDSTFLKITLNEKKGLSNNLILNLNDSLLVHDESLKVNVENEALVIQFANVPFTKGRNDLSVALGGEFDSTRIIKIEAIILYN